MLDGQEVGSLEFSGAHGSLAVARSAKGSWTFKRSGFLRPKITIRRAGSDLDYAFESMNWSGGGRLQIVGGESFRIRRSGILRPQLVVRDSSRNVLMSLRVNPRSGEASVLVMANPNLSEEEHLLAALTWYSITLTLRYENEAGMMAAIVAGANA